jgi:hypothetical protein
MLDTSLQLQSNLFNLMPAYPQGPESLYYNAGASMRAYSQVETMTAPHGESFERVMERVREESKAGPESSVTESDASPDAKAARDTENREHNTEAAGSAQEKDSTEAKIAAGKRGTPETAKAETADDDNAVNENKDNEEMSTGIAGLLGLGMTSVNPVAGQPGTGADGEIQSELSENALGIGVDIGQSADVSVEDSPAPGPEFALSAEDGITFTDTHPLFENKPDVQNMGFDTPVDDASAPDMAQNAEIMLANGGETAGAAKQGRGTKDDLKGVSPGAPSDGETPEPFQAVPDADYQFASLTGTGDGSKPENMADRKKADSKKLRLDVQDMRSPSDSRSAGTANGADPAKTGPIPVKDIAVDLVDTKSGLLASPGDSRQMPVSFEQFHSVDAKSAAQLESFLTRELHNGLNGDIVRQAQVMLRDGGEGLIRLQLHPESLGNVRIKLSMSGNKVDGTITVESPEALNAFERELESLEMAFRDSGFEGASLNLNMQMSSDRRDLFDGVKAGAFSQTLAASSYESAAVQSNGWQSIYDHNALSILA